METENTEQVLLDAAVLARLACPGCGGELRAEVARLICSECGRAYPVVDGVAALIAERAIRAVPG